MKLSSRIFTKVPWPQDPERARLTVVMLAVLAIAGVVLGRAGLVQLKPDTRLQAMARRRFESRVLVRPPRGTIVDRNGEPLAVNIEVSSLAANPSKITNKRQLARLLARVTDLPYPRLLLKLSEKREFVWIKRHLSESALERLKT